MATLDRQISAIKDDCNKYFSAGFHFSTSLGQNSLFASAYDASFYQWGCGLRFTNITIPQGSTIIAAYLTVTAWDVMGGNGAVQWYSKIRGQAADNAAEFSDLTDFDARDWAVATPVAWSGSNAWTDDVEYQSPEIKALIQAIVDRAGWASGNALALSWDDFDDQSAHVLNRRAVWEYEGSSAKAVKLHIEYLSLKEISPSGIEQTIALGTPVVSKLQILISPTGIEQPAAVGAPTLTKVAPTLPDFPDWTMSVRLVGTEIFLPINVQGVSVTIPMEIKAVSVESISVDIAAQTVGHMTISVAAQTVGVMLNPEWETSQGASVSIAASGEDVAFGSTIYASYVVPTGKTLYITHLTAANYITSGAATADRHQGFFADILNVTDDIRIAALGGSWGGVISLPQPVRAVAGRWIMVRLWQFGHAANKVEARMYGYIM